MSPAVRRALELELCGRLALALLLLHQRGDDARGDGHDAAVAGQRQPVVVEGKAVGGVVLLEEVKELLPGAREAGEKRSHGRGRRERGEG